MNLSVAVSSDWGIGYNNELLFRIREDLQRFRELTINKVIVMGHNTFKSLPGGKPLPNRVNIVLSREIGLEIPGAIVCNSLDALEIHLQDYNRQDVFIIGGEKIYQQLLNRCEKAYITKVEGNPPADAYMPNIDKLAAWQLVEESAQKKHGEITYKYCVYTNIL